METYDKTSRIFLILTITATFLLLYTLCPRIASAQSSDEDQIRANYAAAINAFNNKDINALMSYFSLNFLNDGKNYDTQRAEMLGFFSDPSFQPLTYEIVSVSVNGNSASMLVNMADGPETEYLLKEGDNVWRLYGNQALYEIRASSMHWAAGYYANILIADPSHAISAASASGPGFTGTAPLTYATMGGEGFWSYFGPMGAPFIGVSIPGAPQTYTINFTDGTGSHSVQRTITGYVTQFASNLSPVGNVEGPITFSWTGIPGATGYFVEVNDASGDRIVNHYEVPANTTSTPYAGPALKYGETYTYFIGSSIWTAGSDNTSMAMGQFTYGTFKISGMVKKFATNLGLQGITVTAIDNNTSATVATVQTDVSGNYTVMLPTTGFYRITAAKMGYEFAAGPLNAFHLTEANRTAVADTFFLAPSQIHQISLVAGWNFISFPRLPGNKTMEQVLPAPVLANVRVIWAWDSATQQWKGWRPTGGAKNTITEFAFDKGYWMFTDAAGIIDLSAWAPPENTVVHFSEGWNLVGHLGGDGTTLTDGATALAGKWTAIWNCASSGQWYGKVLSIPTLPPPLQPLTVFSQGKAYWIKIRRGAGPGNWTQ